MNTPQAKQHTLEVGSIVDRYEIFEVLGIGGFGVTYKARDPQLAVDVAIKEFLPLDLAGRDGATTAVVAHASRAEEYRYGLERFLEEARTLARFKHNNVVRVTNYLEANGTAYLVMDFEQGQSLSQYLKATPGPVAEEQLIAWFVPVLRGLVEVHKAGFLHRDIKPGNVYLRDEGEPLLIDFGAARQAIGEHSRSVTGIVSAGYAPTEQYGTDAKKQGPWTDLYSVGATLYRCIAGADPTDAPTRQSAVMEGDPDPLVPAIEVGRGHYSAALLQLIDQLLVLPIKQRPESANVALEALANSKSLVEKQEPRSTVVTRQVPRGAPASSTPSTPSGSSVPSPPQARPLVAESATPPRTARGAIVSVLVLLLVGGGYWVYTQQGGDRWEAAPEPTVAHVVPVPAITEPDTSVPDPAPSIQSSIPTTHGTLTLDLTPKTATVTLLDINPRYSPGMRLRVGSYAADVTAPGYENWRGSFDIDPGENAIPITLKVLTQDFSLDSHSARLSYGIGFRLGTRFRDDGVYFQGDAFHMGLNDAISGESLLSQEEIAAEMEAFQKAQSNGALTDRYIDSATGKSGDYPFVEVQLNSAPRRLSYGIAYGLSQRFVHDGVPVNPDLLALGVRDGFEDAPPRLTKAEIEREMELYQEQQETKQTNLAQENQKKANSYLKENRGRAGVTVTNSGLQYEVLSRGSGPFPGSDDVVEVHYRGTLIDGTEFDSSYGRAETVTFGVSQVIPGWTEALQLMPVGSKWRVVIPPELAYGADGAGDVIGPNELLIFEIELLSIK